MKKINSGFTLIELIVVIAIIGILATITTIGFGRFQADSRDTQRVAKATVIAEALEKYYDANGEYPGCGTITQSGDEVSANVLKGIEKTSLLTPRADSGVTNSILCQDIGSSDSDIFSYTGDGSTTCINGSACLEWTITYRDEANGSTKTITSRRKADIATSSQITDLVASGPTFSSMDLDWTDPSGAVSYNVQAATNTLFTTGVVNTTASTNTVTVSGLNANTLYYFRVTPVSIAGNNGTTSDYASGSTLSLDAPTCSAVVNSYTQVTFSWTAVSGATSYTTDTSASSTFASGVTTTPGVTTPRTTVLTVAPNSTTYFRAKSVNASTASASCTKVSATTTIPAPTGLSATTNSSTKVTASWTAVSGASSYNVDYSTSSTFATYSSSTGIATTSKQITGLGQGQKYYFRVYAVISGVSGAKSTTANATTPIDQPAAPSPQFGNSWASGQYVTVNWTTYCPAGTSAVNGSFTSQSWISGDYYYHGFGFTDWWTLGPGGGATVYYWAHYNCQTSFASSSNSPDNYYPVWIHY